MYLPKGLGFHVALRRFFHFVKSFLVTTFTFSTYSLYELISGIYHCQRCRIECLTKLLIANVKVFEMPRKRRQGMYTDSHGSIPALGFLFPSSFFNYAMADVISSSFFFCRKSLGKGTGKTDISTCKITEYFPLRRSNRKTEKQLEVSFVCFSNVRRLFGNLLVWMIIQDFKLF